MVSTLLNHGICHFGKCHFTLHTSFRELSRPWLPSRLPNGFIHSVVTLRLFNSTALKFVIKVIVNEASLKAKAKPACLHLKITPFRWSPRDGWVEAMNAIKFSLEQWLLPQVQLIFCYCVVGIAGMGTRPFLMVVGTQTLPCQSINMGRALIWV